MRFLIDANLPRAVIAELGRAQRPVKFAQDVGLGTAPDEQIAALARESGAAMLSRAMDFADVRRYPPIGRHIGTPARAYRLAVCCDWQTLYGILPYTKTGDRRWLLTHALICAFPLEIESESIALHPWSGYRSRHSYERPCYARRIERSRLNRYRHFRRRNRDGSSQHLASRLRRTRRCAAR
jgi:hypothetical protein